MEGFKDILLSNALLVIDCNNKNLSAILISILFLE